MDMLRYDYARMLSRSKNLKYRFDITEMTIILMRFLKGNQLIDIDPFNEDHSLKDDLILRQSNLSEAGNRLFAEFVPKWSDYIDRGGDPGNIKILANGLTKINSNQNT